MINKNLVIASAMLGLAMALPVFAKTANSTNPSGNPSSAVISCVGAAVNTREASLVSGITAHTQAVQAAYSARATALQQAYANGGSSLKVGIKTAWSAFNTAMKSASQTWKSARNFAWSQFGTASKACKAPASVTDTSNSNSEASGQ